MTALRPTLSTTVGVVDRVHRGTAHDGATAQPARTPSLADHLVLVLEVADLTNGRPAVVMHLAEFATRETEEDVSALLGHHLGV